MPRASTADYLGDPDFVAKIGNHLAGCEDGYFVEVRPDFWQDQFGIVWNRTIDKDIGNVARVPAARAGPVPLSLSPARPGAQRADL